MATEYADFLESKRLLVPAAGLEVGADRLHARLFPFQRDMVRWALRKGRAALFEDTGLGKTFQQLQWAQLAAERTLILAPLAVAQQTMREGDRWGIPVTYARSQSQVPQRGITITNYEMISHFDPSVFGAVVLDESSILKGLDGKIRQALNTAFAETPMRLCCSATPAPNDIAEIANHAEFLGIMSRMEMLASWFVHDDEGWRLKGHARDSFYRWLASWGMSLKRPSDLGYSDEGYDLPPLEIRLQLVPTDYQPEGQLFPTSLKGVGDRAAVRRETMVPRVQAAARLIEAEPDEPYIAWVGLNDEGRELAKLLPDAVLVEGSQSPEQKTDALLRFINQDARVLITKPTIAGHGLNLQHCARMTFVGLSDSYEQYYQCIRRCYRFGQERSVQAHIVLTELEEPIYANVLRKEREAEAMATELVRHVREFESSEIGSTRKETAAYDTAEYSGEGWRLLQGDSVERMREIADESVDLSVFSPPFSSLYVYSPTERDLGNSRTDEEFFAHFAFIIRELLRITKAGRVAAVHVSDIPAMLVRDGYIGLKDFSGEVIRAFIAAGWTFDGRVPIDKNQQAQSIRTHAKGLTMTQMDKDRTWSRPALPDYILKFRKPGKNAVPVCGGEVDHETWIEWAAPTWPGDQDRCADAGAFASWYDIRESDTLNVVEARSKEDERHIAPLQLGTIERIVKLWSNKGEIVFSPFAGIGSEGYQAVSFGRRFLGIELKPAYATVAAKNLAAAEREVGMPTLFDLDDLPDGSAMEVPA